LDALRARATGLEPATSGVTGRRSNQLSYARSAEDEDSAQWDSIRVTERGLIDAAQSLLVVIDTQEGFLGKLEADRRRPFVSRVAFLVGVARRVGVPIVATVESPDRMGGLPAELAELLPAGDAVHRKPVFDLAADGEILRAVRETGRECAVLTGMETDVCVLHSAVGLREAGFRVAVVRDAVQSPADGHEFGLERLRQLGVELVSTKGIFYEWLRTVHAAHEFEREHPDVKAPEDLIL